MSSRYYDRNGARIRAGIGRVRLSCGPWPPGRRGFALSLWHWRGRALLFNVSLWSYDIEAVLTLR